MFALLLIDHRIAFLALALLLIAAAVPLAYAWARLLPEDPPPFPIEPGSFPGTDQAPPAPAVAKRDRFASLLLVGCLTFAYLVCFPGFPSAALARSLEGLVAAPSAHWTIFAARIFVLGSAGAAWIYAALRPGPLRRPLAAAAALVLLLWFLAPLLRIAFLAPS